MNTHNPRITKTHKLIQPSCWILHLIVVGVVLGPSPHVCCVWPCRCLVVVQQSHPLEHLLPFPHSLLPLRSPPHVRHLHSPWCTLYPPFFSQTLAYSWPPAFRPPLAPSRSSWPPNPLIPWSQFFPLISPLPSSAWLNLHCPLTSMHCNRGCKETSAGYLTSRLKFTTPTLACRNNLALLKILMQAGVEDFSMRGKDYTHTTHIDLSTYNTLAEDMAEVGATFTIFGDCHPHG